MSDRILIRGLRLRTFIGFHEWELDRQQDVVVDITIHHDQRAAAAADDVALTVDYSRLRDAVCAHAREHSHGLLETLAEHIATLVLDFEHVQAVDVRVDKLGALRFTDSVAVEIHRP